MTLTVYKTGVTAGGELAWAAYQDGAGAWQPLKVGEGGYRFTVRDAGGRYGVAFVCNALKAQVMVRQFTVTEIADPAADCRAAGETPPSSGPTVTLSGTVLNSGYTSVSGVRHGSGGSDRFHAFASATEPAFTKQIPPGKYTVAATGSNSTDPENRVLLLRDVDLTTNRELTLDMAQGQLLESRTMTISNFEEPGVPGNGAQLSAYAHFYVGGMTGPGVDLVTRSGAADASTIERPFPQVPASLITGRDVHEFQVSSSTGTLSKWHKTFFRAPRDVNVEFPDAPQATANVDRSSGVLGVRWEWNPGNARLVILSVKNQPGTAGSPRLPEMHVMTSRGWLGGAGSHVLPDFRSLEGWNAAWDIPVGNPVEWSVGFADWNHANDFMLYVNGIKKLPADLVRYDEQLELDGFTAASAFRHGVSQP